MSDAAASQTDTHAMELRHIVGIQRDLIRELSAMLRIKSRDMHKLAKANARMARALTKPAAPVVHEPVDHNNCTPRDLVPLTQVREHHRQWAEAFDFLLARVPPGREMSTEVHAELVRVTECVRLSVLLHALPEVGR